MWDNRGTLSNCRRLLMRIDFASRPPAFATGAKRPKGGRAQGISYEKKVQTHFDSVEGYLPGPWIEMDVGGRPSYAQPDGVHFDLKAMKIRIIEVKLKHCVEARAQLTRYKSLISSMFPGWPIHLIEVVKWLDPDVKGFGPYQLCPDPFTYEGDTPGVHILRL